MSQPTLGQLRTLALAALDDQWTTPTELAHRLDLGNGVGWYKLSLVLERLANDGLVELMRPGSTTRRFRRRL